MMMILDVGFVTIRALLVLMLVLMLVLIRWAMLVMQPVTDVDLLLLVEACYLLLLGLGLG